MSSRRSRASRLASAADHSAAVRQNAGVARDIDRDCLLAFRLRAAHLHERLPPGHLAEAAHAGLQDSVPRSGLLSLYARVRDTQPSSWEDRSLVQIWGPRGAVYIVPARDVAVFTLGRLPRDRESQRQLKVVADATARAVDEGSDVTAAVTAALPEGRAVSLVRQAATVGTLRLRWDTRRTEIFAARRPRASADRMRVELARRFVRQYGPVTPDQFAWWAGVSGEDAKLTWSSLAEELVGVTVAGGQTRFAHADDEQAVRSAEPVEGIRLLPVDDTYTKLDRDLLVPPDRRAEVFPRPGKGAPAYWPGALLVDGSIVGTWDRQLRRVTLRPWHRLAPQTRAAIEAEAEAMPVPPLSRPMRVRWA